MAEAFEEANACGNLASHDKFFATSALTHSIFAAALLNMGGKTAGIFLRLISYIWEYEWWKKLK